MNLVEFPCLNCTERVLGCHSECKKYIDCKNRNIELNKKRHDFIHLEINDYKDERIKQSKRKTDRTRSSY